jgi:hypothetical protein
MKMVVEIPLPLLTVLKTKLPLAGRGISTLANLGMPFTAGATPNKDFQLSLRRPMLSIETIQLILTALGPVSFGLSWLILKACRNLIKSYLGSVATDLKEQFLDDIVQNPEIFDPVIAKFVGRFAERPAGGGRQLKIFGFPVPQPLVDMIMTQAAKKFLPGMVEGAENAASSPFG